jgi:hypothetical protein
MANESHTLPHGVAEFIARLQAAASTTAQSRIDEAIAPLSNDIVAKVQRALQPICGHAMDHRVMEIIESAFMQICAETKGPAVDARLRDLLGKLLRQESAK